MLATTASIFEPLGLLRPAVIGYKMFLQKLWEDKLQWDELLPAHLQQEWNQLYQTIPNLSQYKIARKVICSDTIKLQLHGFSDSSERVYGACLYIRSTDRNNKTSCELLCSTSKVAQVKQLYPDWNFVQLLRCPNCTRRTYVPQHFDRWALTMDRFFHCMNVDTRSTN